MTYLRRLKEGMNMSYDFDKIINRTGTDCLKYDFAAERKKPVDILPLWVADMDFSTAPAIRESLTDVISHGIFGYSDGKDDYDQALQYWFEKHFQWTIKKSG